MKTKILLTTAIACCVGLAVAGTASGAFVAIYRNALETTAQRAEVRKLFGHSCTRGGAASGLKIAVGKRTEECAYKTPVVGLDLELAATARISPETPPTVARKTFVGLQLRGGGGNKLELRVFPAQKKVQIARITKEGIRYLAIEKQVEAVRGATEANVLRLRVLGGVGAQAGTCTIGGYLGGEQVIEATDEKCGELDGEISAISVGAPNNGSGAAATFEAIVVRTPVNF